MRSSADHSQTPYGSEDSAKPGSHTVQFYSNETFLVDAINEFIGASLLAGGAGIVVATERHRDLLAQRLMERGLDLAEASKQGRYISLDIDNTLGKILVDGWPDEIRFAELMGDLIEGAGLMAGGDRREVAIFQEMVSLLLAKGKCDAAIHLEQLWNHLARSCSFSLRCAYPMNGFSPQEHHEPFVRICSEHQTVIPDESYPVISTNQEPDLAIPVLLQKAQALENEITERRKAERLQQLREAELWDFLESAVIAMHWAAADGTILWANKAELKLLGYEQDEYVGHHISEFHVNQQVIDDILRRLAQQEELHGYEAQLKCKDGSVRDVRIHSNVLLQNGEFVHTRCFTVDITEQKNAAGTRLSLAAIVESSDDAIVSKDLNGVVTSWNSSAETMFGYTSKEMIGQPITLIIPPELLDDERRILATLRRGERIDHFETVRITKSGERLDVSITVSPLKNAAGTIIGAAKIARDISQRKKMEAALRTNEKLAAVGRLAATVAHEVNNPLEAVFNLIYLARHHETISVPVREYLLDAEEELRRVAHLTKQTLGFYREQKGAAGTHVGILLQQLLSISSSKVANKGVDIQLEIRHDPEIHAIPGEIRQLLANILNNGIDAVNHGGVIRIRVSAACQWAVQTSGVRITFIDSGPGISQSNLAKIFEPFFTTKTEVGTGLGLWICKSIVDRHAGNIRVRSHTTPGRSWTAVSAFLPTAPPRENLADDLLRTMGNAVTGNFTENIYRV